MARPLGAPNKRSGMMRDRLAELGCNPEKITAQIAMNDLECGVCRGKLRSKYKLPEGQHSNACESLSAGNCTCDGIGERPCQSCWGTGKESVGPKDRLIAATELLSYIEAKRKAVEHTGMDGGPISISAEIRAANLMKLTEEELANAERIAAKLSADDAGDSIGTAEATAE